MIQQNLFQVHKFGGTSVLNAERIKNAANIIREEQKSNQLKQVVVLSAMKGTTDDLILATEKSAQQSHEYLQILNTILNRHTREAQALLKSPEKLLGIYNSDFKMLEEILRGVWLVKNASLQTMDMISGMGEVWSAQLLNAYFNELGTNSEFLDARECLIVEPTKPHVTVLWPESEQNINQYIQNCKANIICTTGYIAKTKSGVITTLGRNGSDYSGTIFGRLFSAREITIWTDVDGVLSADPRLVPEAQVLDSMTYNEVAELAYFGAKVVHPATMLPAIQKKIPVYIRNSLRPNHPGTKISEKNTSQAPVKGFSTIDDMALLNIEGAGMMGIPGVAERIFGALRSNGISVVLISQASSEHSVCICIPASQSDLSKKAIHTAFASEINAGLLKPIQIESNVSILAIVGDNMASIPGLAGKFFSALGRSNVNVKAIAQGSSERNISAVISTKDSVRALRNVHSAFYLSHLTINIGLLGPGLIGKSFLNQLALQKSQLFLRGINIKIRAIANSKSMYLSNEDISLNEWQNYFESNSQALDQNKFIKHMTSSDWPHSVIIDCTAGSQYIHEYPHWLLSGINIITPNKRANTEDMSFYTKIREVTRKSGKHFLYSTNVGAGLPMIQTIKDLHATGDKILSIEGILSGTLSYIFNEFRAGKKFSEIVLQAKKLGYTEPDPRDDLSGHDMMRKFVILAREFGAAIEPNDVKLSGLIPNHLKSIQLAEFMDRLPEMDQWIQTNAPSELNYFWCFSGSISSAGAEIGLKKYPKTHPFASLSGADNILLIRTERYIHQPLIIQGPGAGPEVTAGGVFADLLRLCAYLGPQ